MTWVGLGVAVFGFGFTIWQVLRAKNAAEAARDAAQRATHEVGRRLLLTSTAHTSGLVKDLLTACRARDWHRVLVRGDDARERLANLSRNVHLSEELRDAVGAAIDDLDLVMNKVWRALDDEKTPSLSAQNLKKMQEMHSLVAGLSSGLATEEGTF